MNTSYAIVGQYLQDAVKARGTGPVVYHPSNLGFRFPRQFRELQAIANQWRYFNDVQDTWASVQGIIDEIGAGQPTCIPGPLPADCFNRIGSDLSTFCASHCVERDNFLAIAQPGGWHDPDMLLTGNTPCSPTDTANGMKCGQLLPHEEETQMAIWAMASAPLFMSNDLLAVPAASKALLQNKAVLAINQDPLGRMCFRFANDSGTQMWRKDLSGGDVAVALVNMHNTSATTMSFDFDQVGFAPDSHVAVHDVLAHGVFRGWHHGGYATAAPVPPHGTVLLRLSFVPNVDV